MPLESLIVLLKIQTDDETQSWNRKELETLKSTHCRIVSIDIYDNDDKFKKEIKGLMKSKISSCEEIANINKI